MAYQDVYTEDYSDKSSVIWMWRDSFIPELSQLRQTIWDSNKYKAMSDCERLNVKDRYNELVDDFFILKHTYSKT